MKLNKSILSLMITVLMLISAVVIPASAATVKTEKKVMTQYTRINYPETKSPKDVYKYKIKNNENNYLKVEFTDNGSSYWLFVSAKKVTPEKNKPVVTVYKEKNGKKTNVRKYRFTVNSPAAKTYSNINININMTKKKTLKNPYYKDYTFKYDKKIAKIDTAYVGDGKGNFKYKIKALKKGSTDVKVYIKGTKKLAGTFKINAGDYATKLNSKFKTLNLKYNGHGVSTYMADCHKTLNSMLKDRKYGAVYSVTVENEKVASTLADNKNTTIYSVGKGSTTAKVYQKIGKKEETQIASFKINVTGVKMNYVAQQNMLWFNDGIFGNGEMIEYLSPKESFTMKNTIVKSLINNTYTGSHFKKSCYKITYKSTDKSVASVTTAGKVTAKKLGNAVINYTITFSDKSVFKGGCPVEVWNTEDR